MHCSNRRCIAGRVSRFNLPSVRRELLNHIDTEEDFRVINTRLPAMAKTSFRVYDNGSRIMVAIRIEDLVGLDRGSLLAGDKTAEAKPVVELFFNPWNDGFSYYQFVLTPEGASCPTHFVPFHEAHSSSFRHMMIPEIVWELPDWAKPGGRGYPTRNDDNSAFVFAFFKADALFRDADFVGFNVARSSNHRFSEYTTWNPCSGGGGYDADSFGQLYRTIPLEWAGKVKAEIAGKELMITGSSYGRRKLKFRLLSPRGQELEFKLVQRGANWNIRLPLVDFLPGRYRLYANCHAAACEPRYLAFDIEADPERSFEITMTYDIEDDFQDYPLVYTRKALAAELDLMQTHGIQRIHWLDYTPETIYTRWGHGQNERSRKTRRNCGDLLPLAATLARERGLKFIGLFKPFDLAFDRNLGASTGHTFMNLEVTPVWVPEDLARRQDSIMAVHPDWHPPLNDRFPVRFRLYSREPLPKIKALDLILLVSSDNRHYQRYNGPLKIKVLRLRRPHQRWTAAGNIPESTSSIRYALELSGLHLKSPYLAIEFRRKIRFAERLHAMAEAWDAGDNLLPVTLARSGDAQKGFNYWKQWNWHNETPCMLHDMVWDESLHGMIFDLPRSQPTLLEPCAEGAHEVWLEHVQRILNTGADGVGIRTLCHHNSCLDYLMMAFAPAVLERFRTEYDREPKPDREDAIRIRNLRGKAYTNFLRSVKAMTAGAGKILALHLEPGINVPPMRDQLMQFNREWETWIKEGIADELVLKGWFAQSPFIHERVLPLAKQHGIPVHIVDRNNSLKTPRAIERACALVKESRLAGFDGFAWYEAASWKQRNAANHPEFRAHYGEAIIQASL